MALGSNYNFHACYCSVYGLMPRTGYYAAKLREGLEFEDFVQLKLAGRGIFVGNFCSQKYQYEYGENMFGMEIKRDGRFRETGNFYIETAEKSSADKPNWTPSGIMRDDNSWLFCIGDEEGFCVFSKARLKPILLDMKKRELDDSCWTELTPVYGWKNRQVETPTSKGFVWHAGQAVPYAEFTVGQV